MAEHNELGKLGEEFAVDYLQQQGYEILETNWVFDKAEVDIIAQKGEILAVVEVKTRSSLDFGLPQEFVKPKKIQLLVKAINEYVIAHDLDVETRFDIIAIHNNQGKFELEHIETHFFIINKQLNVLFVTNCIFSIFAATNTTNKIKYENSFFCSRKLYQIETFFTKFTCTGNY